MCVGTATRIHAGGARFSFRAAVPMTSKYLTFGPDTEDLANGSISSMDAASAASEKNVARSPIADFDLLASSPLQRKCRSRPTSGI